MLSKIEISLNDSGQFVVIAGGSIVNTFVLKEALQYINYYAKFLAHFPNAENVNSMGKIPVPFSEFLDKIKKEEKKKKVIEPIEKVKHFIDEIAESKININQTPKQTMKSFFNEVLELLAEGQSIELKLTKTDNQLTVLATGKGKLFTATGTPEEFEQEFFPTLQKVIEKKKFSFNIVETEATENEVAGEEDETVETGKTTAKAPKEKKKKEVKPKEEAPVAEPKEEEPVVNETPEASQEPEKKAEEPKAEVKQATAKDTNKEKVFKHTMDEGAKLLKEGKYADAQQKFQEALKLFPDNKLAITEEAKAAKWVKAVADL